MPDEPARATAAADAPDAWADQLASAGVAAGHRRALARLLCERVERRLPPDVGTLVADYRHWLLYESARQGDAAAAVAFERHWRDRLRRCLSRDFDRGAVEELTSAFFERAFSRVAERFAWQCPFTAYLQAVLTNVVRDAIAARTTARSREAPLHDDEPHASHRASGAMTTPESALLASERREIVARCLATLAPLDRHALLAMALDGESGQDIADRLGIKRQSLYMRLHRARQALREALAAAGIDTGEVVLKGDRR